MKILCQSCAAKYTIADDKVVGKVIKIKCKKCSSTIVVNGNDPATFAQQGALETAADEQATKLFTQQNGAGDGAMAANEWTVSVADDDQRTLTTDQIVEGYRAGQIPGDAFVWRDGMGDWLPLVNVPELMALMGGAAAAPAYAPAAPAPAAFESTAALPVGAYGAPAYDANGGYGAPAHSPAPAPEPMAAAPYAPPAAAPAPAPAAAPAARRAGGRGGDLFGGGGGGMAAATQAATQVGERNETSVLFSLGALRAAEEQAAKGDTGGRPKPPVKGKQVSEARVDDIFSLDAPAGPSLAPPPMMAPFIEPPPPPPPPQPVAAVTQMGPASYPMGAAAFTPEQPKKGNTGIIIGALAAVAVGLVVVLVVVMTGKKSDTPTASNSATTTSEKAGSDTKPSDTASPGDTKPSDTAKTSETSDTPKTDDSSSPSTPDTASPDDSSKVASLNPSANKLFGDKKDPKDPDPKDPPSKDPPTKDPPKDDPPKDDGKGGTAEFDRGAASAALSSRAGAAAGCKKEGGPTGSAKVSVTFAPSGNVTQATVGAPFAGTPTGSCIAGAFQGAHVPPFSGSAMTVTKTVSIR